MARVKRRKKVVTRLMQLEGDKIALQIHALMMCKSIPVPESIDSDGSNRVRWCAQYLIEIGDRIDAVGLTVRAEERKGVTP